MAHRLPPMMSCFYCIVYCSAMDLNITNSNKKKRKKNHSFIEGFQSCEWKLAQYLHMIYIYLWIGRSHCPRHLANNLPMNVNFHSRFSFVSWPHAHNITFIYCFLFRSLPTYAIICQYFSDILRWIESRPYFVFFAGS